MNAPGILGLLGPPNLGLALGLTVVVVLAAAPAFRASLGTSPAGRVIFALGLITVMFAGHWSTFMVNRPFWNPDEGQLLAGALTLRHDPVFWRSVDGTTHGPLAQWPLTVVSWAGLPLDYRTARLVAHLLSALTLFLTAEGLALRYGAVTGRLAILPALALLGGTLEPEFAQYCSEHAPVALLAVGLWAAIHWAERRRPGWAFLTGMALAAAPLAKLQAAPLAVGIGLYWLWENLAGGTWRERTTASAMLAAGAVTTLVLVIGPAVVTGFGREFLASYFFDNISYTQDGGESLNFRIVWGLSSYVAMVAALVVTGLACGARMLRRDRLAWSAVGLVCLALVAIGGPQRNARHYWLFIIPPLACTAGVTLHAIGQAWAQRPGFQPRPVVIVALAAALVAPLLLYRAGKDFPRWRRLMIPENLPWAAVQTIVHASCPDDAIAVWGYAPDLYVLTQRRQGTHEAHTYGQIDSQNRARLRDRYLTDLAQNRPVLFIDAVGRFGGRYWNRARYGHEMFPALMDWISIHYQFLADVDEIRIYRRIDAL